MHRRNKKNDCRKIELGVLTLVAKVGSLNEVMGSEVEMYHLLGMARLKIERISDHHRIMLEVEAQIRRKASVL